MLRQNTTHPAARLAFRIPALVLLGLAAAPIGWTADREPARPQVGAAADGRSGEPAPADASAAELVRVRAACEQRAARQPAYTLRMRIRQWSACDGQRIETRIERDIAAVRLEMRWHYRMADRYECVTRCSEAQSELTHAGQTEIVYDGRFVWTLHEVRGQRAAVRARYGGETLPLATAEYFLNLIADAEVSALPDERLEGRPVWVLETRRRADLTHGLGQAFVERRYIDQQSGLQILVVGENEAGEQVYEARVVDFDLQPSFSRDYFRVEPPAGAYRVDLTREANAAQDMAAPDDAQQPF